MKKNKNEIVRLLNRIANGEVSPKTLLPKKVELWTITEVLRNNSYQTEGILECDGRKLKFEEFERYRRKYPQIDLLIITIRDTGVPFKFSEGLSIG